jgi:hypothetical protein
MFFDFARPTYRALKGMTKYKIKYTIKTNDHEKGGYHATGKDLLNRYIDTPPIFKKTATVANIYQNL